MPVLLPVPLRLQQRDGCCLPACVEMVLAYWGIQRSPHDLARRMGTLSGAGTPVSRIIRLSPLGFDITYAEGEISELHRAIDIGIPPIVAVWTGELPYWSIATRHAVVVVGIDEQDVIVNDPAHSQPGIRVPIGDFHPAWDVMANRYALLRPKPKRGKG